MSTLAMVLVVSSSLTLSNCTSTQKAQENSESDEDLFGDDYADGEDDYEYSDNGDETASDEGGELDPEVTYEQFFVDSKGRPHPRYATPMATRRFIMSSQKPDEKKLNACHDEYLAISQQAINAQLMVQTLKLVKGSVRKNPVFYHYCFYYSVSKLDIQMEEGTGQSTLSARMTTFSKSMKSLFLLARALDEVNSATIYFSFLRKRYIQISQDHFARNLEVIGPPLGDPKWVKPVDMLKPAGTYLDNR